MNILNNKIRKIILLTLITIFLIITISSVNAVNVTLNPGDAGGVNSAINSVASGSDVDNTITLNPGTYNKTTDRSNNLTFNGKNLTIQGNGSVGSVIIDAQKLGRLFSITGNSNITFINITFINGNTTSYGGAIYKTGNGTLNIINCTFNNNSADWGGAVYFTGLGDFTVSSSNFTNNLANYSTFSNGGAISIPYDNENGSYQYKVINSNFINNTARYNGGALFFQSMNYYNLIEIDSSSFINNSALYGGACSLNGGDEGIKVINSLFENNKADRTASGEGGAIEANDNWDLNIINSTFINNTATRYGGAISNYMSYYTTIINCSFINNTCPMGGAFYDHSSFTRYTNISNSSFTGNDNVIMLRGNDAYIIGCNFTNNTLAINITGNNNTIVSCNILNNTQGIFVNLTAVNTTINYNRIFNNTIASGVNLDNNGINTNANLNWWGDNNPLVSGITLANYFVMNVTNATPLVSNGSVSFNYTFKLNTNDEFNSSLLPYFITNVYNNVTTGVIDTFDARFDRIVNNTLSVRNQTVEYTFITDNEIQRLDVFANTTKIKTNIEVNNTEGKNGEIVTLIARLTDEDGNPLAGKELTFHIAGQTFIAITDSNGIASIQYTINEDDFTDDRLLFKVTFEEDDTYFASNGTGIVTLIIDPIPPKPPTPTPNPSNETTKNENINNTTVVAAMKKTGIPINLILLILLSIIGFGYYKRK